MNIFKHRNIKKGRRGKLSWLRSTGATCIAFLCIIACTGCFGQARAEELDALKSQLANASQEIEALKESNEAAKAEIDDLKSSNKTANAEIEALKNSNETANAEIEALKNSNEAAKAEIEALKGNGNSAQVEIEELKGINEAAKAEIEELKEINEAAKAEIDDLKSSNKTANAEIEALKDSNKSAKAEIDELKGINEAAKAEIEALKEQIKELQDCITSLEPNKKIRIYIDQGHNPTSYHNSGAIGNGLYEQDLTFTIGCLLAQLLESDTRFEVCLSRPSENTVLGTDNLSSLEARVKGAKDFGADYFISLHTNSFENVNSQGIEVLVASQEGASYSFGSALLNDLVAFTNLQNRGIKLRPDLHVLQNATMPAVLVEMGFITNSEDAELLSQNPGLFARGIYEGILTYFNLP